LSWCACKRRKRHQSSVSSYACSEERAYEDEDTVKKWPSSHQDTKEIRLTRHWCYHDTGFPLSRTMKKNFGCLNFSVYSILLWQQSRLTHSKMEFYWRRYILYFLLWKFPSLYMSWGDAWKIHKNYKIFKSNLSIYVNLNFIN
jgi:hypothetical protein